MTEPKSSDDQVEQVRFEAKAYNAAGQIVTMVQMTGEPDLVRHHLLHQDDVESVEIRLLGDDDAMG